MSSLNFFIVSFNHARLNVDQLCISVNAQMHMCICSTYCLSTYQYLQHTIDIVCIPTLCSILPTTMITSHQSEAITIVRVET